MPCDVIINYGVWQRLTICICEPLAIVLVTWSTAYSYKVMMCNPLCALLSHTLYLCCMHNMHSLYMLYVQCMWADTEFCCGWLQEVVEAAALVVNASIVGS